MIEFQTAASIIIQEEKSASIVGFELGYVRYSNANRDCLADLVLIAEDGTRIKRNEFTVWSGKEYDDAGQWTDEAVNERIKQLLTQK